MNNKNEGYSPSNDEINKLREQNNKLLDGLNKIAHLSICEIKSKRFQDMIYEMQEIAKALIAEIEGKK